LRIPNGQYWKEIELEDFASARFSFHIKDYNGSQTVIVNDWILQQNYLIRIIQLWQVMV
jgi:hypothetical protein